MTHGTEATYKSGCRCEVCRAASAEARRKRRHGLGPGLVQRQHGINAYKVGGCRCPYCKAANAAAHQRWAARNRERARVAA